jgi:hypothetical protein
MWLWQATARRSELGYGIKDAPHEQREDKVTATIAIGASNALEADPARGAEGCGDMAVRQGADDGEGLAPGRDDGAALEHAAQPFDMGSRPVGKIAQRALTDTPVLAIALTQKDGGRRVPVGHRFDIHGEA